MIDWTIVASVLLALFLYAVIKFVTSTTLVLVLVANQHTRWVRTLKEWGLRW